MCDVMKLVSFSSWFSNPGESKPLREQSLDHRITCFGLSKSKLLDLAFFTTTLVSCSRLFVVCSMVRCLFASFFVYLHVGLLTRGGMCLYYSAKPVVPQSCTIHKILTGSRPR